MFYYLLILNIVLYKINKKNTQFNFYQFLKYTTYNLINFKYIYIYIYIIN